MVGLPKSYIKKYGVSKKAWREYKKAKSRPKKSSPTRKTSRRVNRTAKKKTRRRSNKWGTVGTVFKLALGAYAGNLIGGQIAKYTGTQGPLIRVGGGVVGAIAAKKLLGKMDRTVATGAAAVLAGGAAVDFIAYMKSRQNGG